MQFQADVLGVPVVVPEVAETTALGAAYLAGVATGRGARRTSRGMWREAARYEPQMSDDERETLLAGVADAPMDVTQIERAGVGPEQWRKSSPR